MSVLKDGSIAAFTGDTDSGLMMIRWYEDGADPSKWPACQNKDDWSRLIVLVPGLELREHLRYPAPHIRSLQGKYAWGCGRDFALGAMAMGADARKAVEVASELSSECGFGVEAYDMIPLALVNSGD